MSGTDSAILYDTLKQSNKIKDYTQAQGRMDLYTKIGAGISSVLGSLLANVFIKLPFYINTIIASFMFCIALLLVEPNRVALESTNHIKDRANCKTHRLIA